MSQHNTSTKDQTLGKSISIVIPVFNEQNGIRAAYEAIAELMESQGCPFEIVISDNGSTDDTEAIVQRIAMKDKRCKYVRLSRNFGYQNNITVGMAVAGSDAIIVIDSDLQDPVELIPTFIRHWRDGFDVVYGVRVKRTGESRIRVMMTMMARRMISWLADYPLPPHSADFRLITRQVRDAFMQLPERSRYVRGMIHWVGFRQIGVPYTRKGRLHDKETRRWFGDGFLSLVSMTLDAVFSFSLKPMRLFSLLGFLSLMVAGALVIWYLTLWLIAEQIPRGFTTQTIIALFHLGVTSLGIGILGEYIGRTYMETKQRPGWIINYTLNCDETINSTPGGQTQHANARNAGSTLTNDNRGRSCSRQDRPSNATVSPQSKSPERPISRETTR